MIEEMKKGVPIIYELIEKEFGTDGLTHLDKWFESKLKSEIAEACRQQREICAEKYRDFFTNDIEHNYFVNNAILNAPSPLDEVK